MSGGAPVPVRDAASLVLVRDAATAPSVLMGRRGRRAAFLPGKMVFPGGALEAGDRDVPLDLPARCRGRLAIPGDPAPEAIAAAAIRELFEEAGQIAGRVAPWETPPPDWADFARTGHRPDATAFTYMFRAITPPGRPRRFDARIFAMRAEALATDPDDFTRASGELSDLGWIPLYEARRHDLPFVTALVLGEVAAALPDLGPPDRVPFVANRPGQIEIEQIT